MLDLSSKVSLHCSTSVSLVLTSITISLISMFGGSTRYFARRSCSLMADFHRSGRAYAVSWVREILSLTHVGATSTRLPVLFSATAPAHRLLRVLGEVAQTTSGKWITHRRRDARTGTPSAPTESSSAIKPASGTAADTQHGHAAHAIRRSTDLREAYEVEHGSDLENWPHRHPGIVIDAVQFVAHAACLGCQWIDQPGTSMSDEGWREASAAVARRHERSHGEFRGEPDQ